MISHMATGLPSGYAKYNVLDEPPPYKQRKVNEEEEDKGTTKEIKIAMVKDGKLLPVVQPKRLYWI